MARWTLAFAAAALAAGLAWAAAPPAVLPAMSATTEPLAAKNLLLAGARAGTRLVAVGEHGHVLLSDDQGATWRQAATVPTVTTLTAVHFLDAKQGWAVGHGGVVIGTTDAGNTWTTLAGRLEGKEVLLSVWFRDARHGLVVGAFGYAATTTDGGRTWAAAPLVEGEEGERHLNQIFPGADGSLWVAAESGWLFHRDDDSAKWQGLKLPYKGSIWGGTRLDDGTLLVWGMRGNLLRSDDGGKTFNPVVTGTDQSLGGALQLPGGALVLAGLGGAVLHSADGGRSFQATVREDRAGHAAVLPGPPGQVVLLGQAGAQLHPVAAAASAPR